MDSSTSRAEAVKPVILKAGIPLAISVAGLVFARFVTRRYGSNKDSSSDNQVNSSDSDSDTALPCMNINEEESGLIECSEVQDNHDREELEIISLRNRFQELQQREIELETQFVRYHDLKEQESVLMELKSMLMLEKAYVDFFHRKISFMEAENTRLHAMVILYLKILEQIHFLRSENGLLQRKVKRLTRRTKELSIVIKEKNLKIGARERELLRSLDETETSSSIVKKLEDKVKELKATVNQLQEEKNELLSRLNTKSEMENGSMTISMEDYNKLLTRYEKLQEDRADEVKELIYLRWSSACLRHKLMRNHSGHQEQEQEHKTHLEKLEFHGENLEHQMENGLVLDQDESCFAITANTGSSGHHVNSKRKKILKKLKRWVEGSEKRKSKFEERDKNEMKCFGTHSLSEEAEEEQTVLARRSCSSA